MTKFVPVWECYQRPVPQVQGWTVNCPNCNHCMPYEPEEQIDGSWELDPAEWPLCRECGAMFEPEAVAVRVSPTTPHLRNPRGSK